MNNPNQFDHTSTQQTGSSVNLIELIYHVLDKAILIILVTALCAVFMGKASESAPVITYYSTSKLYLINTEDANLSISALQASNLLVNDYLAVFQTNELHQRVADKVDVVYTADQLSAMVSASNILDTHIISISVRAGSADEAELLANTYVHVLGALVEEKLNIPQPVVFEDATPAVMSVGSNSKRNYTIGAVIGLFISCVAAVFHGLFDDRIYTPEDLKQSAGVETLGILTRQEKPHPVRRRSK